MESPSRRGFPATRQAVPAGMDSESKYKKDVEK